MGRVDFIEIDEKTKEIFVKDDFGIYIMYECALSDMKDLEEEILKIGSFYITKHESLFVSENEKPYPTVDRISLLEDLLEQELDFHFNKVVLIENYLECYEHICDPLEQQRLISTIVDLMGQRPRLNLNAPYFKDSYKAEVQCLMTHQELVRELIYHQMLVEKEENKRMQAYLDLSYVMANEQKKGKWRYSDPEDFFNELQKRKNLVIKDSKNEAQKSQKESEAKIQIEEQKQQEAQEDEGDVLSPTKRFLAKVKNRQYGTRFSQAAVEKIQQKEPDSDFAKVLGLPPITIETLYRQYKEKDDIIIDIMNEYSNYVRVYEGYPDFLQDKQVNQVSKRISKLSELKVNKWSLPINFLDFYDSLDFINKLFSILQINLTEIVEVLKPHDSTLLALIEKNMILKATQLFRQQKSFCSGDQILYEGFEYLEDESILGNSDKINFYIKDFISHLEKANKKNVNPFFIAKLDIDTIQNFDFPVVPNQDHPFKREVPYLQENFTTQVKQAAELNKLAGSALNYSKFQNSLKDYQRRINTPSMLTLYCNTVEVMRLRQELVMALSETNSLTQLYEEQCKLVSRTGNKPFFNDCITFESYLSNSSKVNFIDDGGASFIKIDLAVNEFDPCLKSNLNFRNPDSFKMMITNCGVEELRAILHYQLMQKQILIVAVRYNQLLIDHHQRALTELELVKKGFSLPNMVIKLQNLISKVGDGFSLDGYQKEKGKYNANLNNEVGNYIYQVTNRKTRLRNYLSKKFGVFLTQVASTFGGKPECSQRVLRAYKLKLLHAYCKDVLKETYYDSMKIQAINACQSLRTKSQLFAYDEKLQQMTKPIQKVKLFQCESTDYFENVFAAYNPSYQTDGYGSHFRDTQSIDNIVGFENGDIYDYFTIPSTITLCKLEAITQEELTSLNNKNPSFEFNSVPNENEVEDSIKQMLQRCTECVPDYYEQNKDKVSLRVVDFQESYDYSTTGYGQMMTYYCLLERVFELEYFMIKFGNNVLDTLRLEQSVFNGLPFWKSNENEDIIEGTKTQNEKLASQILNQMVKDKKAKVHLADDMCALKQVLIKTLIKASNAKVAIDGSVTCSQLTTKAIEYLSNYQEYRFSFLLYTIGKLIDDYYDKKSTKEVKYLSDLLKQLSKKDHIQLTYKYNAFHLNLASVRHTKYNIDTQNLTNYYANLYERNDFQTCIQPLIDESAQVPPQLTLISSLFYNSKFKTTSYSGQIPHYPRKYPSLESALINIYEPQRQYTSSTITQIQSFMKDYLYIIHKERCSEQEQMDLEQIKKCKKVLGDFIQARQLKHTLMCWLNTSTIPIDPETYSQYHQIYRNEIFWKILTQKDSLPSMQQLETQKTQQAEVTEEQRKMDMMRMVNQQFLIDQLQNCKAEQLVLTSEIERQIVVASLNVIEQECASLANCFSMSAKPVEQFIHPFQQFASTMFSMVDKNSHLDVSYKFGEVQKFITKLRNRGTDVETLTSGPGVVYTIKDFNECLQQFCRSLMKYSELELRSRSEDQFKKEAHLMQMLYYKDRKIETLETRLKNASENIEKLINSKMYQKGNQLIYELDQANRQLRLFKDYVYDLERELRAKIKAEFINFLQVSKHKVEESENKFKMYQDDVEKKVEALVSAEQAKIERDLKRKAEEYKNLQESPTKTNLQSPSKMDYSSSNVYVSPAPGEIPFYTPALKQMNDLTEQEAREELALFNEKMRKLRVMWKVKEVLLVEKFEREIFNLKKHLTSNSCLWEQLAEAEKREKVIKQELVFTQQTLAASEKVVEKLKEDLKKSENDRARLNQYKTNKQSRLEELESKVRKFEIMDNINLEKLIDTLGSKEKELLKLRGVEQFFNQRVDAVERKKDNEMKNLKSQFLKEQSMKQEVLERLETLRTELRMLEKNEGSMAEVWKQKCKELVDICNKLKDENESISDKMNVLLQSDSMEQFQQSSQKISLPKLMSNNSSQKMTQNLNQAKIGAGAYGSVTRQSSQYKHEMERSFVQGLHASQSNELSQGVFSNSKMHQRGKSLYEPGQVMTSRIKENKDYGQQNVYMAQQKNLNLGIFGQAHLMKGFQSVRESGAHQEESASKKINRSVHKESEFSQPSTNISKVIRTDQNTTRRSRLKSQREEEKKDAFNQHNTSNIQQDTTQTLEKTPDISQQYLSSEIQIEPHYKSKEDKFQLQEIEGISTKLRKQ